MERCGIEITSNDPALLAFLSHYPDNPSWVVREADEIHYLICPDFQSLAVPHEVWQRADEMLFTLNGIFKLKFKSANLTRGSKVAYFDETGQVVRASVSRSIGVRLNLSGGESYYQDAETKNIGSIDIWMKAQKDSAIEEALQHYSNPHNWFNLYKTYEVIKKDTNRAGEKGTMERGLFLKWTKGQHESFEWSANKFRHSSLGYHVKPGVALMSLEEATMFLSDLLFLWLQAK